MDRRNLQILLGFLAALILTTGLMVYFGGGGPLEKGEFDKGQRFTAKPGTTRENAMILTSANRASTKEPQSAAARAAEEVENSDDPLEVKSLSGPRRAERDGQASATARSALGSFTPEAGLRKLDEALALPQTPEQSALLHEARGQLLAQLDPPDYDGAQAAFEEALALAPDPRLDEEIAHEAVQVLIRAERGEEALKVAREQLAAHPPDGEAGYKLQLLQGQLLEQAGDFAGAEAAWRGVLQAMEPVPESLDDETALSLSRVATMRLTQMFRAQDRLEDLESVTATLKKQVARSARTERS